MQQVCFPVITTVTCNKCEHRIALIRGDKVPLPRRAEDQLCAVAPSPIAHRSWRWCSRPGALQGPPQGGSTAPPLQEGVHPHPCCCCSTPCCCSSGARLHPLLRGGAGPAFFSSVSGRKLRHKKRNYWTYHFAPPPPQNGGPQGRGPHPPPPLHTSYIW